MPARAAASQARMTVARGRNERTRLAVGSASTNNVVASRRTGPGSAEPMTAPSAWSARALASSEPAMSSQAPSHRLRLRKRPTCSNASARKATFRAALVSTACQPSACPWSRSTSRARATRPCSSRRGRIRPRTLRVLHDPDLRGQCLEVSAVHCEEREQLDDGTACAGRSRTTTRRGTAGSPAKSRSYSSATRDHTIARPWRYARRAIAASRS